MIAQSVVGWFPPPLFQSSFLLALQISSLTKGDLLASNWRKMAGGLESVIYGSKRKKIIEEGALRSNIHE